jgi:hypothetical protein
MPERRDEAAEHLGGSFAHRSELRLLDLFDIFSQMVADFPQPVLDFLNVISGVAAVVGSHDLAPWVEGKTYKLHYQFL